MPHHLSEYYSKRFHKSTIFLFEQFTVQNALKWAFLTAHFRRGFNTKRGTGELTKELYNIESNQEAYRTFIRLCRICKITYFPDWHLLQVAHGGAVVSPSASLAYHIISYNGGQAAQQEDPGFDPRIGHRIFLCGAEVGSYMYCTWLNFWGKKTYLSSFIVP